MQNKKTILWVILIIILISLSAIYLSKSKSNQALSPKDATYIIEGKPVTLKDGISKTDITTQYFGNEVQHDFDGDGRQDTAFLLTQNTGGSGTFYYIVVALNTVNGYKGSNGLLLGDRIAPQTTEMSMNPKTPNIIVVNYADRKLTDSFVTPPSVGKSIWVLLDTKTMQLGEVVQNFEGEVDMNQRYQNSALGFSIKIPNTYKIDESYKYSALGPGKDISGIKFTIPATIASGTNLSTDTYISVEKMANNTDCKANLFLMPGIKEIKISDDNRNYSLSSSSDAAAGNRYDETVYAISGSSPCLAIRYFIHYGAFENYPSGTIKQFDKKLITGLFDEIRRSLLINR